MVAYCAMAAALDDPRFAPMTPPEIEGLAIEISVLSPLVEISSEQIEPGKHGLMVTRGVKRGVLLPQVAQQFGWTAERFLEETCVKADLERDDWKQPGTRVQGFTAEIFSEAGFHADRNFKARRATNVTYEQNQTIRLRCNRPRKSGEG